MKADRKDISSPVSNSKDDLATNDENISVFKWFGRKVKTYLAKAYMFLHCLFVYRSRPRNIDLETIGKMRVITKKIFNFAHGDKVRMLIEECKKKEIAEGNFKKLLNVFNGQIKLEYNGEPQIQNLEIVQLDAVKTPVTIDKKIAFSIFGDGTDDIVFDKFLSIVNELIKHNKMDKNYIVELIKTDHKDHSWGSNSLIRTVYGETNAEYQVNKLKSLLEFIKDLDVPDTDKIDITVGRTELAYMLRRNHSCNVPCFLKRVDHIISFATKDLYNKITDEASKQYLVKQINDNITNAIFDRPSINEELITRLLSLILDKSICYESTKKKCIDQLIHNYAVFYSDNVANIEIYVKNFSNAVNASNFTKDEKSDILSRLLDCLKQESLKKDLSDPRADLALKKGQEIVQELIKKL